MLFPNHTFRIKHMRNTRPYREIVIGFFAQFSLTYHGFRATWNSQSVKYRPGAQLTFRTGAGTKLFRVCMKDTAMAVPTTPINLEETDKTTK